MAAIRGCEICKRMIEPERAENDPRTTLCSEHAKEIRKYGNEFITVSSFDRTSKPTGIKVMVAGVTTEMVRNEEALRKLKADYEARQT